MTHNGDSVLSAAKLQVGYNERIVIDALSLEIAPSIITALVGPNGSGKSTLLKTLARLLKPSNGAVSLDGKAIRTLSTAVIARIRAILPQGSSAPAGLSVRELVEQGRCPQGGALRLLRQQDHVTITTLLAISHQPEVLHLVRTLNQAARYAHRRRRARHSADPGAAGFGFQRACQHRRRPGERHAGMLAVCDR